MIRASQGSAGTRAVAVRALLAAVAAVAAPAVWGPRADEATDAGAAAGRRPLEFVRVHVPGGRLADVPLGSDRYVPMSAGEFEEGVARLTGSSTAAGDAAEPAPSPLATAARYVLEPRPDGRLEGAAEFDIGWPGATGVAAITPAGLERQMPLEGFDVRSGVMRTAAGTGEAVVFGRRDGTVAMATAAAGTYGFQFRSRPPVTGERHRLVMPLVPALASTVVLRVPRGVRPVAAADDAAAAAWERLDESAAAARATPDAAADDELVSWRLAVGPRPTIGFLLVDEDVGPTELSLWSDVSILGRQALFAVAAVPATAWREGTIVLEKDPDVFVTAVESGTAVALAEASWLVSPDGRRVAVELPPRLVGRRDPLILRGAAAVGAAGGPLPLLRAPDSVWRSGGMTIRLPPELAVAAVLPEHCVVVPPEAAAAWPLAPAPAGGEAAGEPGPQAPRYWLEHQSSRAAVALTLVPQQAVFDVARVTTVDLSPAAVTARATCDVRVDRGDAFELSATVAPQWIIDTVEILDAPPGVDAAGPVRRRDAADTAAGLDWKFEGDTLRIGLESAAKAGGRFFLRVTGRHPGIPLETGFPTAAVDMVRFDGEGEKAALLELRTNPETTIEFDSADPPPPAPEGRLASLVEDGPVRARAWAGFRAASRTARLVRRRPPLDVRTQVRLTVRDERLTEAFTFECRPAGSDLDSIVVQFSAAEDEPLEWSLLPPAVGSVSARRIDPPERRGAAAAAGVGGDRWLVEITPAARGAVTIRGARTTALTRRRPIPLAWVDGANSTAGEVHVRDAGRSRPSVVNHRLAELPPTPAAAPRSLAEFAFDARVAGDDTDGPAAELVPWGGEPRACAWREVVTSWCHASGRTEHETIFEIDNHGRATVLIEVARGHRLQGVSVDGARLPLGDGAAASGSVTVELPLGRRLVTLAVRTAADVPARPQRGLQLAWQVAPAPVRLADVARLQREWVLLLPPGLEILRTGRGVRVVADASTAAGGWLGRLLGATVRSAPRESAPARDDGVPQDPGEPIREGFRRVILLPEAEGSVGVTIVPAEAVAVASAVVAAAAATAVLVFLRRGRAAAVLVVAALACGALWAEPPFAGMFRVACWAGLAAHAIAGRAAARSRSSGAVIAALLAALPAAHPAAARAAAPVDDDRGPLKVFIMPPAGGDAAASATALVPEPLFRLLVRGEGPGAAATAVRVLDTRVVWQAAGEGLGGCRLTVGIDADAGGSLRLDQAGSAARFIGGSAVIDGVPVACRLDADGGGLRTPPLDAGRHTVEVDIAAAVERRGDLELATLSLPVSPRAVVELPSRSAGTGGAVCECAGADGVFAAAPRAATDGPAAAFDAANAVRVRVVRSRSGGRIADGPRAVVSRNDVTWSPGECILVASFAIEPGDAIVRQVEVHADEGLQWLPPRGAESAGRAVVPAAGILVQPLGSGRHLVEFAAPGRGPARFELSFRLPLASPAGVFDLPGAWLDGAATDTRTIRLTVQPGLAVRPEPPARFVPVAAGDADAGADVRAWRCDIVRGAREGDGRFRIVAERRPQAVRGTQQQQLVFSAGQVRLRLDARLDAAAALVSVPLEIPAGCVIDRTEVHEEDPSQPEAVDGGPTDVRLTRTGPAAATLVFQRPKAGRFRLVVEARLPGRPADRGDLPSLHARLDERSGTRLDWRVEDGQQLVVTAAGQPAVSGSTGAIALAADGPLPTYALEPAAPRPEADAGPGGAVAATEAAPGRGRERVELADVRLVVDGRGGMWGLACFELVAAEKPLVLRLPRSWRLFDVSVDGKPAAGLAPAAAPDDGSDRHADTFWEVRLLDVGWPRTVVALFKGELGTRVVGGEPVELVPPSVVGLPTRKVLWTLELPHGVRPRVAAPGHLVSLETLAGERRAARQRLDDEFAAALDRAGGGDQERVALFRQARRDGTMPVDDAVWARTLAGTTIADACTAWSISAAGAAAAGATAPTVELVPDWDPGVVGRLLATLLVAAAGTIAVVWGGRGAAAPRAAMLGAPALGIMAVAWIAWLDPAWPGWLLAGVAAAGTLSRRLPLWLPAAGLARRPAAPAEPRTWGDGGDVAVEVATELFHSGSRR